MTAAAPYGPPTPAPSHIGGWCWSAPGACGIADTFEEAWLCIYAAYRKPKETER